MSHEGAYDSPLSVRTAKISQEKSFKSATLAWCVNEQPFSETHPIRTSEKCRKAHKSNISSINVYGGSCSAVAKTLVCTSLNAPVERVAFINNLEINGGIGVTCVCNNHISETKKAKDLIRSVIPWGIPWGILVNSIIQITIHFMGCDDTFNHFVFSPVKKQDIWRFITYHFLHSGSNHLFLNVFLQLLVATPLETEQGHLRTLFVYFGGILYGALGSALLNPSQAMIGASAGVYSLLISHVSHCVLTYRTLSYPCFRSLAVVALCLSDGIFVSYLFFTKGSSRPKISFAAHGCGALAGLLLGFTIYRTTTDFSTYNYYRYVSLLLCCVFVIICPYFIFVQ